MATRYPPHLLMVFAKSNRGNEANAEKTQREPGILPVSRRKIERDKGGNGAESHASQGKAESMGKHFPKDLPEGQFLAGRYGNCLNVPSP